MPPPRPAASLESDLGRSRYEKPGGAARRTATSSEEEWNDSVTARTSKSLAVMMSETGTYFSLSDHTLSFARRMTEFGCVDSGCRNIEGIRFEVHWGWRDGRHNPKLNKIFLVARRSFDEHTFNDRSRSALYTNKGSAAIMSQLRRNEHCTNPARVDNFNKPPANSKPKDTAKSK